MGFAPVCSLECRKRWLIRNRFHGYAVDVARLRRWSRDLAYFLGLMLTDGNVTDGGAVSFVSLDRCSTEFVRDFVAPTSPIREEITKAGRTAFRWSVWSRDVAEALSRFGIKPRKSKTVRFPRVPERFVWDFLRGVLDGDGSVDAARRASIATGSEGFASDLAAFFAANGMKSSTFVKARHRSVMLNVASSRELARRIYRPGCPHLARKRERFGFLA